MARRLVEVAAGLLLGVAAQNPEDAVIRPGQAWADTDGNRIYAGGANLWLEPDGTYYLVGEGKKVNQDLSQCFNQYSSKDLQNWKFEGCVLNNKDIGAHVPPPFAGQPMYRMERPKIFKCPGSQKYVMWFHCDTDSFSMSSVGVLTSDAVTGPFTWASNCFKPDGQDSYDQGTYVDAVEAGGDGKAYLIRSVQNKYAGISQMTDDCTNVTGIVSQGPDMEGQAIMRDASTGTLYAMGSHLTGWAANAAQFVTSPNKTLVGASWTDNYNPSGSSTTWNSQSTFIFPFKHADGHITYMYMGDRWNANGPGGLDNMTLIWLPLVPPTGPTPVKPAPGWTVQLAACNPADALQQWTFTSAHTAVHTPSGLCASIATDGSGNVALDTCAAGRADQVWWESQQATTLSNTQSGTGSGCVNWNNANQQIVAGNPVIAYDCGSSPSNNAVWRLPPVDAVGQNAEALSGNGKRSGLCAAVVPDSNPSQWTMPWFDSWSLKDF